MKKKIFKNQDSIQILILAISITAFTQNIAAQFPVPDQALTFDEVYENYNSMIHDISGNDNDAFWWTYREGTDQMYGGFRPDSGVNNGAWYMSGYHLCCEDMASPSMDFIILAGNNHIKDAEGFQEESPLYHTGFNSLSIAFWFKSDRIYANSNQPCPPEATGMHEQEILFSMGSSNGIAINNFKGYYEVRVGYSPPEGPSEIKKITYLYNGTGAVDKTWQHIAVTFDGDDNGKLSFYLDGELAQTYLNDDNPLETGYSEILANNASAEIGAQNGGGLFGNVPAFFNSSYIGRRCITELDTSYRTGWPANGYFDDYVFYKNEVLTPEEIKQLATTQGGIATLIDGEMPSSLLKNEIPKYVIYPNPAEGKIKIRSRNAIGMNLEIVSLTGQKVLQKTVFNEETIDISSLPKGVYIVRINQRDKSKLIVK